MALKLGERRISAARKIKVRLGWVDICLSVAASHVSFSELCARKCHSAFGAELTSD
jgi:hypothetical protein